MYTDLSLTFLPHAVTRDVAKLTDIAAVRRAIKHLILTPYGARPFQPELGSSVGSMLFELSDSITERLMVEEINRTISTYEPRAIVSEINVSQPDPNSYNVDIIILVNPNPDPLIVSIAVNPADQLIRVR